MIPLPLVSQAAPTVGDERRAIALRFRLDAGSFWRAVKGTLFVTRQDEVKQPSFFDLLSDES